MSDKQRGLYAKYEVKRLDGSSEPGGKHENCFYFVLDCDHDPHAAKALHAYYQSCRKDFPFLAEDLLRILMKCKFSDQNTTELKS